MKIFLVTNVGGDQAKALQRVSYKHRLLAFPDLDKAKWGLVDLTRYKQGDSKMPTRADSSITGGYLTKSESTPQTLEEIKSEIDEKLLRFTDSEYAKKQNAMEIGGLLILAKPLIPHGDFKKWIEETWPDNRLPYSTADLYRDMHKKLHPYKRIVRHLPWGFLVFMTRGRGFTKAVLQLIEPHAEALKHADRAGFNKIESAHDKYAAEEIELSAFIEEIKKQIKFGSDNQYNDELHPKVIKGVLEISKIQKKLKDIESFLNRFEKYNWEDVNNDVISEVKGAFDIVDEIERLMNRFIEITKFIEAHGLIQKSTA